MSFYADYINERTNDKIIESSEGFVTYRYIDNLTVYIADIYIVPSARKSGAAGQLADMVAKEARDGGYTEMLGTVVPSAKNSTTSLKVLLGYGMSLKSATQDLIIFRKDL